MAGPNVEVFKFGIYMFFPLWVMYKFGDPEWYESYVKPYGEMLWPAYETTNKPPRTESELRSELARLRAEREARTALKMEEGKIGRLPREDGKDAGPARTAIEFYRARAAVSAPAVPVINVDSGPSTASAGSIPVEPRSERLV